MIEELGIRDLGVIAEAALPLGPGFTAVTGETGAGKTMVVTALGLLLGARSDAGTVRSGAKQAWVEGRWLLADPEAVAERVADAGGEIDAGELILGR
ncbi:AAA family ATPase, partial [Agromyces binzhouensis]